MASLFDSLLEAGKTVLDSPLGQQYVFGTKSAAGAPGPGAPSPLPANQKSQDKPFYQQPLVIGLVLVIVAGLGWILLKGRRGK